MSWKKVKIEDVCTIEKGNIGIMKAIPGEFPLVVLAEERKTHNEFQFDDDAVIIPLVSSTGHGHRSMKRIFFQSGKFSIGSILCAVIPKDKTQLSAEFLFRYLDYNKEKELVSRMRGMANVTLPMKEIASVEIPLPPLKQQQKLIKEFQNLETTNNKITTELSRQLELVRQLRQAFLREAMQGQLVPQDETNEPAKVLLERIKAEKEKLVAEKKIKRDKPLPAIAEEEIPFEIPENWVWCRLGEICDFRNGKAHEQYISDQGRYILVNSRFVSTSGKTLKYSSNPLTPLSINDIAIVMSDVPLGRALGRCYLVETNDTYTLNQRIGAVRPLDDINSKYLTFALDRNQHFLNFDDGKKQTNLRKDQILSCPLHLPPLPEQTRIVAKLKKLMAYCESLETSIRESASHAENLLQVALKEALAPPS